MWIVSIALFCWGIFSIFVGLGLISQVYSPKKASNPASNVEMVIVSIASKKVEKSLMECITHHERFGLTLWILVDEGSELINVLLEKYNLVIVPKSYRVDLVGKGRAMNFFIEKVVLEDKWYCFIDDDNLVMDTNFMYEIPYYEKLGYSAMNPVLYPRMGRSGFAFIMDFIRWFDDITLFRLFTGLLKTPIMGLHGELLTVRGSVLKEVGYNHRTITEDFLFATQLVRRKHKTWQSSTVVSIRSPNSLGDLMKQRGRWFKGVSHDWVFCPTKMKFVVMLRLTIWVLGIFGSWLFVPFWLFTSCWYAIPGGIAYWGIYIWGTIKLGKLQYLLMIPIYGIVESASWMVGLRDKKFFVIDKN